MAISNYNTDPDLNVDISGINIAEGCPPSGINNAIRQMMADVRTFTDSPTFSGGMTVSSGATISGGISADTLTVTSGATISGGIVMQAGDGNELTTTADNVTLTIAGGTSATDAPFLALVGKTKDADGGRFILHADNGANECNLAGFPDGTLTWGKIVFNNNHEINCNTDSGFVRVGGGTTWRNGASLWVHGEADTTYKGQWRLRAQSGTVTKEIIGSVDGDCMTTFSAFRPYTNGAITIGASTRRVGQIYTTNNVNVGSDERIKQQITVIPDNVLDAWDGVQWTQYKLNDACAEKGADKARTHNGLIAQHVSSAFVEHDVDPTKYGFFCHDEWGGRAEIKDDKGNIVKDGQEAGDVYSIRYEEALCIEAAYQRRRANRAEARITALEQRLNEMEQAIAALAGGAE